MGEVLGERRRSIGIPKAEIARRVNVSPGYVGLVERGLRRPSKAVLMLWAKALSWEDREDGPYTSQLLAFAGHLPSEQVDRLNVARPPLASMSVHYPQPRKLEKERLTEEFRRLLDKGDAVGERHWEGAVELVSAFLEWTSCLLDATDKSHESWGETIGLLKSYLDWLKFRLRG